MTEPAGTYVTEMCMQCSEEVMRKQLGVNDMACSNR